MEEQEKKSYAETPLMKQYNQIKAKYPTALLLFRVGDFYETFGEDAIKTSRILGIVLTRRANGKAAYVELAGFPHHSLETYLPKLVRAGEKVAICDQLEDPKMTKTIVKRGVTELVTPGIAYNDRVLEHKENNYLAALHIDSGKAGVAFLDVSTGEFFVAQGSVDYVEKLVQSFIPSEIVVRRDLRNKVKEQFGSKYYLSTFDDWVFTYDFGYELLTNHFGTKSLKGFGVEKLEDGIIAAGAVLHYLSETHHDKVQHINKIARIDEDNFVWLDQFTIRNLELLYSTSSTGMSLLDVIDKTNCPMGSRMLKRWMVLPLKDKIKIEERLDVVGYFIKNTTESEQLSLIIRHIGDMERLISKVSIAKVNPKEVLQLKRSLTSIPKIQEICLKTKVDPILHLAQNLNPCSDIADRIEKTLQEEAPLQINKGNVIKEGVSTELDELRSMAYSGKDYVQKIREREIIRTGIPSLKVGYNNVFGYYLEVTNVHKDKVPEDWIRKQTLANNERYITPELKEYEDKILGAEEKILELESRLFDELVTAISGYIQTIQNNGQLIAQLDVLLSFAQVSRENNYSRPKINDGFSLDIKDGRHPVIEKNLSHDENYIANDVFLDNNKQQIIILTGPNMSGKSALLRQTALIVLMAQIGCYVSASKAEIGIIDKIFTRVGASDNISSGESTFMVEMNETASILNNISNRSLILLDEIGRGTSTYDGISIAWAISEYLHEHPAYKAKILFATHYHELNEMASSFKRIKNFHIHVKEINNKIIFLRKMVAGGSEHSFGIHVARMAGMPKAVLNRSTEILHQLEKSHSNAELTSKVKNIAEQKKIQDQYQLSFIQLDDPLLVQIKEDILNIDIDTLTPVEALMKLNEIKKLITKK